MACSLLARRMLVGRVLAPCLNLASRTPVYVRHTIIVRRCAFRTELQHTMSNFHMHRSAYAFCEQQKCYELYYLMFLLLQEQAG